MAIKKMMIENIDTEPNAGEIQNIGADASDVDVYRYPLGSPEAGKIIPDMSIYVGNSDEEKLTETLNHIETYIENLDENKQEKLDFDTTPTQNSDNPVKSGGIYAAIDNVSTTLNNQKQNQMQYKNQLPLNVEVGTIIQWVGNTSTTGNLITGHFYQFKGAGSWEEVPVSTVNVDGVVPKDKGGTGSTDGSINGVLLGFDGTTYGYYKQGATTITPFRQPTGAATAAQVLDGVYFANASSDSIKGTMPNRSNTIQAASTSTGDTNKSCYRTNGNNIEVIPAIGYYGSWDWNKEKITIPVETKTVTSSRSAQTVTPTAGKYMTKVTVNALVPSGTYKPTARANNNDMTATGNYRYVDTTAVPNANSGTYSFPAGDAGGTKDLQITNTVRYVNAQNVYTTGYNAGRNVGRTDSKAEGSGTLVLDMVEDPDSGKCTATVYWIGSTGQSKQLMSGTATKTNPSVSKEITCKTNYYDIWKKT